MIIRNCLSGHCVGGGMGNGMGGPGNHISYSNGDHTFTVGGQVGSGGIGYPAATYTMKTW